MSAALTQPQGLFGWQDLQDWVAVNAANPWLVDGLLAPRSLTLLAGVSGLGKSPLLYQLALCVATGTQFLGRGVTATPVLYCDCENSPSQVLGIVGELARFLGVEPAAVPLAYWNRNLVTSAWDAETQLPNLLATVKPGLVVIDPLSAFFEAAELDAGSTNKAYGLLRRWSATYGTAFLLVHHLRKDSTKSDEKRMWLERTDNVNAWMESTRGAVALVNGSDLRLGVDWPADVNERKLGTPALVVRGFARATGPTVTLRVNRVVDSVTGAPRGYELAKDRSLGFRK